MSLPFFYIKEFDPSQSFITLDENNSRHAIQVLRMKQGEQLNLTDGKGNLLTAEIIDDNKRSCQIKALSQFKVQSSKFKISIAISLLKNANRFEWFLEKATEIGVTEIIPLICERTERQHFRLDRMKNILISAMLQSQQCWLPELKEPCKFADMQMWKCADGENFIAHCEEGNKNNLHIRTSAYSLTCIGPEGDFTKEEIELALKNNFIPVSLGKTRLRTETAGMVAATLLKLG